MDLLPRAGQEQTTQNRKYHHPFFDPIHTVLLSLYHNTNGMKIKAMGLAGILTLVLKTICI
jgi:hypothetical protein